MVRNGTHCWLLCGLIPSAGRMAARIAYQRALTVRRRRQAVLPERHAARQKSKVKTLLRFSPAGAKLFYLSGMRHGKYLNREVLNLGRFISVMKFRPLSWRTAHGYLVCSLSSLTEGCVQNLERRGAPSASRSFACSTGAPLAASWCWSCVGSFATGRHFSSTSVMKFRSLN